jgi:hypothetical protein
MWVAMYLDEIQRCYEAQLARDRTLAGRVMVRFKCSMIVARLARARRRDVPPSERFRTL